MVGHYSLTGNSPGLGKRPRGYRRGASAAGIPILDIPDSLDNRHRLRQRRRHGLRPPEVRLPSRSTLPRLPPGFLDGHEAAGFGRDEPRRGGRRSGGRPSVHRAPMRAHLRRLARRRRLAPATSAASHLGGQPPRPPGDGPHGRGTLQPQGDATRAAGLSSSSSAGPLRGTEVPQPWHWEHRAIRVQGARPSGFLGLGTFSVPGAGCIPGCRAAPALTASIPFVWPPGAIHHLRTSIPSIPSSQAPPFPSGSPPPRSAGAGPPGGRRGTAACPAGVPRPYRGGHPAARQGPASIGSLRTFLRSSILTRRHYSSASLACLPQRAGRTAARARTALWTSRRGHPAGGSHR